MAENLTAHTEVPSEGVHGGFPPFQKDTFASQLVWLAITFVLLYWVTAKIGLPRVGAIIKARRDQIEGDMADAHRLRKQADQAFAAYEKALAEARARAHAIAHETRDRLTAEAERDRKTLEDRLNAKLAEAEKTISATRSAAMSNVREIAAEAASEIVARLIGSKPSEQAAAKAVDDVLER
ncbi:MAG TPA: F0F1 ATP synthase subunit B' [Xanthobacteraceae bacterium]|nr:F0F1 ATP synthase subunit B' [Xanthobacteraceae bacterium]